MKRLIVDLDGTLTVDEPHVGYPDKKPNLPLIEKLRTYRQQGFEIAIHTARNMQTYNGSVGLINANTLPGIIEWLQKHDVPYDEIHTAKPWCGTEGFYIDDRAVRPDEFVALSHEELTALVKKAPEAGK